jgi:kynureninase
LSAGPGAIAGFFIHEKYFNDPNIIRFAGWWGHNKSTRFQMPAQYDPIANAESWQVSNPNILSLVALQQALLIFDQVDLLALREKNKRLVGYLEQLLLQELNKEVSIITPSNPEERGCQLSFRLTSQIDAHEIERKLFDVGIVCDVRKDLLRVAPMGLYTNFEDLLRFVHQLKIICRDQK